MTCQKQKQTNKNKQNKQTNKLARSTNKQDIQKSFNHQQGREGEQCKGEKGL